MFDGFSESDSDIFEPRWLPTRAYALDTKSDISVVIAMSSVGDLFKGSHFGCEINSLCVRWYLRCKLCFRDSRS
jgi:hypothetical protein